MGVLFDIVGSFITASLLFLAFFQFNSTSIALRDEQQSSNTVMGDMKVISESIEYDVYKAGFRVPHDIFIEANSGKIKFVTDLNNNGIIDTVTYYVDSLTTLENPSNKLVYRKINYESGLLIGTSKEFKITYNDSNGVKLHDTLLVHSYGRRLIQSVSFDIICESDWENNESYQYIEWRKTISPRNINLKDW